MLGFQVRRGERRTVLPAAAALVSTGVAAALLASAGDALFLARVGTRHLGTAFAISSALLIGVLAWAGAAADRVDRGRLLVAVLGVAAACAAAMAAGLALWPRAAAMVVVVAGKQLAATADLAFWVVVAERFDARQARRLVPLFVAAHGAGVAAGSFAVGPLAEAFGAGAAVWAAGAAFAVAAAFAARFAASGGGRTLGAIAAPGGAARERPLLAGYRAVKASPLARRIALLVAVAGVFAPILYYLLGVVAAASYGGEAALAEFLGRFRGAVQIAILLAQLAVGPALFARAGVAPALLVAPLGALAAAAGLAVLGGLWVVAAAQASARLLDTAVETPAEKLAQNLLPRHVRGRVAGFVDGVAKRAGAIAGGLLASALVVWPDVLAAVTVAVAAGWLVVAWRLRRRFPELAVAELASAREAGADRAADDDATAMLVDERTIDRLRAELSGGDRAALATDLIAELGERGRVDAIAELAAAATRADDAARPVVLAALAHRALRPRGAVAAEASSALAELLARELSEAETVLVVRTAGRLAAAAARTHPAPVARCRAAIAALAQQGSSAVQLAASAALARIDGDERGWDDSVITALDGDAGARAAALDELCGDVARLASADIVHTGRLMERCRALVKVARDTADDSRRAAALDAIARGLSRVTGARDSSSPPRGQGVSPTPSPPRGEGRGGGAAASEAEVVLFQTQLEPLVTAILDRGRATRDELRAAAVAALGALRKREHAGRLAAALGDPDDGVRRAAARGLRALGDGAVEALLVAASYGRRPARNAALEILRERRLSGDALDELIDAELAELDRVGALLAALASLERGELVVRRLEEHRAEIAHTLFLLLEARLGRRAIGAAARRFLRARDGAARARALEALDTALPRPLATRTTAALDAGLHEAGGDGANAAVRAVLGGDDHLARALVVHALDREGRAAHRDAITSAAAAEVGRLDPFAMLARLSGGAASAPKDDSEDDVPRSIETVMVLSRIAIFSELTTRQLAELAEVVRWRVAPAGEVVVREGDPADAMFVVASGALEVAVAAEDGPRQVATIGAGEPFGEMALFEGEARSATVTATEKSRLGRIERGDFEELVDDVPGIALAICRVLSRRVRDMNSL